MDDGGDVVAADQARHQVLVVGRADHQRHAGRQQVAESGRQIVERHHAIAGVVQCVPI